LTYSTSLNGTQIGSSFSSSQENCSCLAPAGCHRDVFDSGNFPAGFPGYVNGGNNIFSINIAAGVLCVQNVELAITYTGNPKQLAITNVTDPIIPARSGLVNDCVLYRSSITATATNSGTPQSGVNITLSSDRNVVAPGTDTFTQPNATDASGTTTGTIETRKRGVVNLTAKAPMYADGQFAKGFIDADFENPFRLTGYITALESDSSGRQVTDPCGITGAFFASFLREVNQEGTGQALDGTLIHVAGTRHGARCYEVVTCPPTRSGACAQTGMTIAVDTDVMPLGSQVNIDNLGLRTAQDIGSGITGEHIDVYVGAGRAAIAAFALDGTHQKVRLIGGVGSCN
jgi:3D (Asp-Asp-Asp) domain-containing protein